MRRRSLLVHGVLTALLLVCIAPSVKAQPVIGQGSNLGTFQLGYFQVPLSASGGTGAYTWDITAGALPPGVSLRTDLDFASTFYSAGLVGVATAAGNYGFTLRVTSGGLSSSRAFTLRISPFTLTESFNYIPDAYVGQTYVPHALRAINNAGPVTYTLSGGTPPGMTLSAGGVLSGTPTASGFYLISFSMNDGVETVFKGVYISVYDIEITTPGLLPIARPNVPYTAMIEVVGGSGSYTFTSCSGCQPPSTASSGLPSGLVLNESTGTISGTPTFETNWTFTLTVTDSNHVSVSKRMSLPVVGTPTALPLLSAFLDGCTIGWSCIRTAQVSSGGTPPFAYSATGLPRGMDVVSAGGAILNTFVAPTAGEILGTPTEAGVFNVTVTATDAEGQTTSNVFRMHVNSLISTSNSPIGALAVPFTHTLRVIGGPTRPVGFGAAVSDYRTLYTVQPTSGHLPFDLTFTSSTFTIAGTPQETGSFFATYRFSDLSGETLDASTGIFIPGPGTSTIQINTFYDLGTILVNSAFSRQLTACCAPSYAWTRVNGELPPGINLSSDGIVSGFATTAGTYEFLVRVADATFSDNQALRRFKLTVSTTSPPSLSVNSPFPMPFGNVGSLYSVPLTVSGGTGPYTWTIETGTYPPPGVTVSSTGTITGTPTSAGQYSFTVRVTDTVGTTSLRGFSISIYPPGVTPPLNLSLSSAITLSVPGILTVSLAATGGLAPYHYSLTPGATSVPGMRVQDGPPLPQGFTATGAFIGVIAAGGVYPTSIRVTDSAGHTLDRPTTVTVQSLRILPESSPPKATVGQPYSFALKAFGGSGNYAFTLAAGSVFPPGISVDSVGLISGVPVTAGNFFVSLTLSDLTTSKAVSRGFTLVVDPFAISTAAVLPLATVGAPYTQVFNASGCGSGCTWTTFSGSIAGLTLNSAGVLSGTPTFPTATGFTVQATGSGGTTQKVFSILVAGNPPTALTMNTATFGPTTVGGFVSTQLSASGGLPPYSWSLRSGSQLPSGVFLEPSGELSGSSFAPGFGYLLGRLMEVGTYTFTLDVTDTAGATAARTFTWYVSPLSNQYSSLPISGSPLVLGTPYSQPLLVIGGTNSYTFAHMGPMPPGLTLNASTGIVSGTPANTGSFTVPIQATDTAGDFVTASLFFNISSGTAATLSFSLSPNLGNVTQGSSPTFNVTPSGGTPPYTLIEDSSLPAGFVLISGDTALGSFSPGTFLVAGPANVPGTYSFTLRAQDAAGNIGVRTFTFIVSPISLLTSSLPDASVGVPYSQGLVVFDNAGPVTWSNTSAMPPGLAVSGSGVISGTPTQAGTFSFSLAASDASGATLTLFFALRVSGISIVDTSLPAAVVGRPYSHTLSATGGGAAVVWSATGLPAGLSISASGTISGTPTSAGAFLVQVTATDGVVPVLRRFVLFSRLAIPTVLDLSLTTTLLTDVTVGQMMTVSLSASGGVPPYSWSIPLGSSMPPGLQFLSGAALPAVFLPAPAVITGVPANAGTYVFDLVIADSAGAQARRTFTLKVSEVTILGAFLKTGTVGALYTQQFTGAGGTPPYTFTMSPVASTQEMLPPGLTLSTDGLLSGTTTSTGSYAFLLQVRDSLGRTFVRRYSLSMVSGTGLRVLNLNPPDAPIGTGQSMALLTSGSSTYTWSHVSGTMPAGVELIAASATATNLAGAPAAVGDYVFTLRATDRANAAITADHTFRYRVSPMQVVSPPTELLAEVDLPGGHVGNAYSHTFRIAGGTAPYAFSVSPFTPLPVGMSLSAAGVLSGIPQQVGNSAIILAVADAAGHTFTTGTMFLVVTPAGVPAPLLRANTTISDATVGVPYSIPFDLQLRGGTAPYSWTISGSSALPPGLKLLPGSNGVQSYIGGIATTVGTYPVALTATDSAGQSLEVTGTIQVTALALSPDSLSTGRVGSPYSAALVPSGGAGPYSVQLASASDMPPGLSLNAAGILGGTPSDPGNFLVGLTLTDSAGASLFKAYRITIDNAAGQAPAVSLAPRPVQVYYEIGGPLPAAVPVSVQTTSDLTPYALSVSGVPGASVAPDNGTTPSTAALSLNVSGLAAGTYVGILGVSALTAANQFDAVPVTLTVTPQPPCQYSVNPTSGSAPFGGSDGSFSIATGPSCAWTATASDPSWIRITSSASGTGPRSLAYTILPNASIQQRNGSITVNGQVHAIAQFGIACSFAINPSHIVATSTGGSATVTITASSSACSWNASGLSAAPASGTGSGSVTIAVPANPDPGSRSLSATIASQLLTVDQTGISCSATLSPYSASATAAGGQGTVEVTTPAGCTYGTVLGPSWISVTSGASGIGGGPLVYSIEPNSRTEPRSGSLTIGGQIFQVTQAPLACSVTVDASGLGSPHGPGGGVGSIGITTNGANCSWTASSQVPWASVSTTSGTGNATIGVVVSSNAGAITARSGTVTINGQTVNISQGGTTCTYALRSAVGTVPGAGGNGSVGAIAPTACAWSAVSNNPDWLTVTSSGTGGTADVTFAALANPTSSPRIGTLTVAGLTYTVTEAGAPCSYTLATGSTSVASDGIGSGTFGFSTASSSCAPAPLSYVSWISVTNTVFNGTSGTVNYSVAPNVSNLSRVGTIQVGDRNFTITQLGGPCGFSLHAYGALFTGVGGTGDVIGSQSALGCTPVYGTDQPSFVLLGTLAGPTNNIFDLPFSVSPANALTSGVRIGRINFGGQLFTIKQTSY